MQSLPLPPKSVALSQPTYSFAIPTAYSHEPRRPPLHVTSLVPAAMDPGLSEALRRDSQRILDMRSRTGSPTAALQNRETIATSRAQPSSQQTTCNRPPARQGPSESNVANDKAPLASSRAAGPHSRYSASSTDSKVRPISATSCASVHASARSSAPTSVRTSPSPYKARSVGVKPQEDITLHQSKGGHTQRDPSCRLATASSAGTTVSSSTSRPSTKSSDSSRQPHHAFGKAPCPVHGTLPLRSAQSHRNLLSSAGTTSGEGAVNGHLTIVPSLPFNQPAATDPTRPEDLRPGANNPAIVKDPVLADSAIPVREQTAGKLVLEPNKAKSRQATPISASKAVITVTNDADRDYALLQAMHTAEAIHLHSETSYFTPKNGCESIFMPRPSLQHSHSEPSGATGCIAFPRVRHDVVNPAKVSEHAASRDHPSMGPRTTFERNRRLTHSGNVHKAAMTDLLNSEPLPYTTHRPPLRSSASLLDLSKVAHGVPGQTLQQLLPRPPVPRKGTARESSAGASSSAAASIGRTKSEGNLRRSIEAHSNPKPPVPTQTKARVTSAVEDENICSAPLGPSEVMQYGHDFEAERLTWRRDFERSIERRELAGCAPLVRSRCRSKPRSRESVLEAGPHHSHFSLRRSNKETLQHDPILPPRSGGARALVGGDTTKGYSNSATDKQGTTGTERTKTVSVEVRVATEPSRRRLPGQKGSNFAAEKATVSTNSSRRPPAGPLGSVPVPADLEHEYTSSSCQRSVASRHALATPQRPSVLRQLSIPRKAPPVRPSSAASETFDLAAAGEHSNRISARFSIRGGGDGAKASSSRSSQDSGSEELVVIGRPSQCADIEVLDSATAAVPEEWHTQSLGSHDGSESMLALEAEKMLLQQSASVAERLTVDEIRPAGGSLATARMGSSSSRRTMVPSPPPRPHPDEPLPSIPGRLSSDPHDAASEPRGTDSSNRTSGEALLRLRASRSIGRPDSLLEPPYDGTIGSEESSPSQALSPVMREP
jgi:hypothetical protein